MTYALCSAVSSPLPQAARWQQPLTPTWRLCMSTVGDFNSRLSLPRPEVEKLLFSGLDRDIAKLLR